MEMLELEPYRPHTAETEREEIEERTQTIRRELLAALRGGQPPMRNGDKDGSAVVGIPHSGRLYDRLTEWAMADEALKVQLFRFIDVLPSLRSSERSEER